MSIQGNTKIDHPGARCRLSDFGLGFFPLMCIYRTPVKGRLRSVALTFLFLLLSWRQRRRSSAQTAVPPQAETDNDSWLLQEKLMVGCDHVSEIAF